LLSALWNQRLLQTTLHLLAFALATDVAAYVDALLASARPRLSAIRDELSRFARAIVDGEGSTLPVAGWGDQRREPTDGVCARVFDDADGFYAEAADEAARLVGRAHAALVREAVAWDALRIPRLTGAARTARFEHAGRAYEARMGSSPQPAAGPIVVRATPARFTSDAAAQAVALEWLKGVRSSIEPVAAAPLPLVATAPDPAALRERASE